MKTKNCIKSSLIAAGIIVPLLLFSGLVRADLTGVAPMRLKALLPGAKNEPSISANGTDGDARESAPVFGAHPYTSLWVRGTCPSELTCEYVFRFECKPDCGIAGGVGNHWEGMLIDQCRFNAARA